MNNGQNGWRTHYDRMIMPVIHWNNNEPLLNNGLKTLHANKPWICMGCGLFTHSHLESTLIVGAIHQPTRMNPLIHLGAPTQPLTWAKAPTHPSGHTQPTWAHPTPSCTHPPNYQGAPIHRPGRTHTPTWVHPPTHWITWAHTPTHRITWAHPHTHLFFWIVSLVVSLQIIFVNLVLISDE